MMMPWLSWPARLALTTWRATVAASASGTPCATSSARPSSRSVSAWTFGMVSSRSARREVRAKAVRGKGGAAQGGAACPYRDGGFRRGASPPSPLLLRHFDQHQLGILAGGDLDGLLVDDAGAV